MLAQKLMVLICLMLLLLPAGRVEACPFCSAPQLTLAEQIAQTDAAVLAEWVSGVEPDFDAGTAGTTTYRIEKVIKSPVAPALVINNEVTIPEYYPGTAGQFSLLTGSLEGGLVWLSPVEISKESFAYVLNSPSPENDPALRLKYYLKHLESADPLVADDAYAEFANAPYATIASIKAEFPREKIRKLTFSPETPVTRLGLYGLMLGLCGDQSDAERLREKISANEEDFRLGIDGLMAGYLLLTGSEGLVAIEKSKFIPSLQQPSPVPFSETFAAIQAIKFMWEYVPDQIEKERLRESMRMLIAHPDLADLVIIDLARWEDWSLLPKLQAMYGAEPYNIPAIKRAIVGYLVQCLKQKPTQETVEVPPYVVAAEKFLAELEETDPKTVKTARLLFR